MKVFQREMFAEAGLETNFSEEYYSISKKNVIRGLHFQLPPMDHVKMVYCVHGEVLDVVLDLRVGSPTYGKHVMFELSATKGNAIYIPKGMAHGFLALREESIMVYSVTSIYSPSHDAGILWNSAKISWPITKVELSDRDHNFPMLENFDSPFKYELD